MAFMKNMVNDLREEYQLIEKGLGHEDDILILAQNHKNIDENFVKKFLRSSDKSKELLLDKASFYGNVYLLKFLLFKSKEIWSVNSLTKAFKNTIMVDNVKAVETVLEKCQLLGINVKSEDMLDLALRRGKTAILTLLGIPFTHRDPLLPFPKSEEFAYVNVQEDIVKLVQDSETKFVTFSKLLDVLLLKKVHYETDCCPSTCEQTNICHRIRDVIKLLEFVLCEMSKNFAIFKGILVKMIGSLKEETRIGAIDESDTLLLLPERIRNLFKVMLEYCRKDQKLKIRKCYYDDSEIWTSLDLPEELKPFVTEESFPDEDKNIYYGYFDITKYFLTFFHEFHRVIKENPNIPGIDGLTMTTEFTPCHVCKNTENVVTKFVRCRHRNDCDDHQQKLIDSSHKEMCNCNEFTSPAISYSKIGLVLHVQFFDQENLDPFTLDIDVSPPSLTFSQKQYKDQDGRIHAEPPFNGDPAYKRQYLEKYRPVDWWPEWLKTVDMRDVGQDPDLLRGGRIRFYNGDIKDIMIEESLLFFRQGESGGTGGTLSGNKRLVYATMKIMKKIFGVTEGSTSFLLKYRVDDALKDTSYEREPICSSLRTVLEYWAGKDKFEGVCRELREIGVTEIRIDYNREGGGLQFIGEIKSEEEIEEEKRKLLFEEDKFKRDVSNKYFKWTVGGIVAFLASISIVGLTAWYFLSRPVDCENDPVLSSEYCNSHFKYEWKNWSECLGSCGTGKKIRVAEALDDQPLCLKEKCPLPANLSVSCNELPPCNCKWSWSNWSPCYCGTQKQWPVVTKREDPGGECSLPFEKLRQCQGGKDCQQVMMITGGVNSNDYLSSVEIYDPINSRTCKLPKMKYARYHHGATGLTVCGSKNSEQRQSCEILRNGSWSLLTLNKKRARPSMWTTPKKTIMVLGGSDKWGWENTFTSEKLNVKSDSFEMSWNLKSTYDSCSIDLGSSVVVTGGDDTYSQLVFQYDENGVSKKLPNLIYERTNHGCASYIDKENNVVLVVAGGSQFQASFGPSIPVTEYFHTSEIQVTRSSAWKEVEHFPLRIAGLRGTTINNVVYMTGGYNKNFTVISLVTSGKYVDDIYKFHNGGWLKVGNLQVPRSTHGISMIDTKDVKDFCV